MADKSENRNRESSIAFVFPGQGSQYPGMGKDLADQFSVARRLFEEADDALGFSISQLCFEGPAEQLQLTENTQPAILVTSIATLRAMESEGFPRPAYVAGHSLGEYSALVAAGAIELADAARTVRARGRYMQEAVPAGVGARAAGLGADPDDIERICAEAGQGGICAPANINGPNQVVIAGHAGAVDRAAEMLKAAGAKRVVKLNVSAPFHCALMMPAQQQLSSDLDTLRFQDFGTPVITNVDAKPVNTAAEARDALRRQVSARVRWLESVELLTSKGVSTFVEVGPGKVLTGLLRQINREAKGMNVEDGASLRAVFDGLS